MLPRRSFIAASAAEPMKQTPTCQLYARIAPQPADWPVLLTRPVSCCGRTTTGRKMSGAAQDALMHYNIFSSPALASTVTPFLSTAK